MLLITLGYIVFTLALFRAEQLRTLRTGPDLLTVFMLFFALQLLVPGVLIPWLIWSYGPSLSTEVPYFDRVHRDLGVIEAALALLMSVLFTVCVYAAWKAILKLSSAWIREGTPSIELVLSSRRWTFFVICGLAGMWLLLESLGGGWQGYQTLILFRNDLVEKTVVTANLFSQTQTFAFVALLGMLLFSRTGNWMGFLLALIAVLIFGLMGVSRRALAIPFLLIYCALVLENKRFYVFRFVLPFFLLCAPIITYGKYILHYLSSIEQPNLEDLDVGLDALSGVLLVASDVGISLVNSWATLLYVDMPFRFGVDHLLSIVRRVPDGFLGFDIDFPERIVRTTTEAFVGPEQQDIPPGLVGGMWLDLGIFGPIAWGVAFGIQVGLLQILLNRVVKSREVIGLFIVILFVVQMPVYGGTFDFSFHVDIFLLFFILYMMFSRLRTIQAPVSLTKLSQNRA